MIGDRLATGAAPSREDLAREHEAVGQAEEAAREAVTAARRAHERSAAAHRQAAQLAAELGDDEQMRRHEGLAAEAMQAAADEPDE